jgi:hypothetical protein
VAEPRQLGRYSDGLDGSGVRTQAGARYIFLRQKGPVLHWGPQILLFTGYRCYFPGIKRPGLDVDRSPPSNAEVKNEWSYTSTPPICLYDVDGVTFVIILFSLVAFHPHL